MVARTEAKLALDSIIKKARVHLYKPIQIAEILYHSRVYKNINILNLEDYRNKSKIWRDEITAKLLGRCCSSTQKFQDDLFNEHAMPPKILSVLNSENLRTNGAVESYIYRQFDNRHTQLNQALSYCLEAKKETFDVKHFIDSFWHERGLKRSIDKIYEIVVYSLFSTLVHALNLKVEISVDEKYFSVLGEFEDFTKKVMCVDFSNPAYIQSAKVYRVGVTNAADRGLDMYSNWGPAIQIKHLSLDTELAQNIVESISCDRVVIVCKDAEEKVIVSLLNQIGWKSRIQSIVTENDLINWYEKALRGKYAYAIGDELLYCLCQEIADEFPSTDVIPECLKERHYESITDNFWK